jgi:hypothetical protein
MENLKWEQIKNEVLENCKKAGITNKAFITTLLKVERRVETCKNDLYARGRSWEYVCNSYTYAEARRALNDLNGKSFGKPKFLQEYKTYCEQAGSCWESNVGDWMA